MLLKIDQHVMLKIRLAIAAFPAKILKRIHIQSEFHVKFTWFSLN